MLALFFKLRLLSLLLLVSWAAPMLVSGTGLHAAKAAAIAAGVHGDGILFGVQIPPSDAKQVAAPSPCRKCPNHIADGSLQCNGPMLASQINVAHSTGNGVLRYVIPRDHNAERRDVAPDPPPPRLG
nr:hypothetical protein [uncultured Cohaesibacter sp.]